MMIQLPIRGVPIPSQATVTDSEESFQPLLASWSKAILLYNSSLTRDEAKKLDLTTCPRAPFEILLQAALTARDKVDGSRWPGTATIQRICQQINRYAVIGDLIAQQSAEYTALVWGAFRFLLLAGVEETASSLKLSEGLESTLQIVFRAEEYAKLFSKSSHLEVSTARVFQSLQDNLTQLYAEVLNFLIRALKFFEKRTWRRYVSAGISPFESKFQPILKKIERCESNVEKDRSVLQAAADRLQRDYENGIWLRHADFETDLKKLQAAHVPGTCKWFLSSDIYHSWQRRTSEKGPALLWLHGKPGSGKSTLSSKVIEDLQSAKDATVVYALCKDGEENKSDTLSILRNLLFQLMERSPRRRDLHHIIQITRLNEKTQIAQSLDTLWKLLRRMLEVDGNVYVIIDGLDECRGPPDVLRSFVSNLGQVIKEIAVRARLAVVSRLDDLYLDSDDTGWATVAIHPSDLLDDIKSITESKIASSKRLSTHPKKEYLQQQLIASADGMILWVKLMIQELEAGHWNVDNVLSRPPRGLAAMYTSILRRIIQDPALSDKVKFTLQLVVAAVRPLRLEELAMSLAVSEGLSSHEDYALRGDPVAEGREAVLQSSPMLNILEDGTVQLTHASLKDYLLGSNLPDDLAPFRFLPSATNGWMAFVLVNYLSFECFDVLETLATHPLLDYATLNLVHHASRSGRSPALAARLLQFFNSLEGWRWVQRITVLFKLSQGHRQMMEADLRNWAFSLDIAPAEKEALGNFMLFIPRTRFTASEHVGHGDLDVLSAMDFIADALSARGRWDDIKEAVALYEEILHYQMERVGPQHEEILSYQHKLGQGYMDLGLLDRADEINHQLYEARKEQLGPEHPDTVLSLSHIAVVALRQGRYPKAEELHLQILEIRKRTLGPEHPSTLLSLAKLGEVTREMGSYQQAETIQREVFETTTRVLGTDHPDRLISANNLGLCLNAQNKVKESADLFVEIIEIKQRIHGPNHPSTLITKSNLAETLISLGEKERAVKLQREVLDARMSILGPDHPDTVCSLNNLAISYLEIEGCRDLEEAEKLATQAFEARQRTLGLEHPGAQLVMGNLALVYHAQDRLEDAERIERLLVNVSIQCYGPDDSRTSARRFDLVTTIWKQQKFQELAGLQKDIVDVMERTRGPDHPDTENARKNLDRTQLILGIPD